MKRSHDSIGRSDMCIITFYDEPFRKFGDLAWMAIQEYAALHSIDPIRFQEHSTSRPPSWEKIPCIQKAFDLGYEFVFWVDADAMIMKDAPDIRGELGTDANDSAEKDFFLVRHAVQGGLSPNMGVLVIRNSARSRQVLSDIWNMAEFINHRWWEQAAFISHFDLIDDLPKSERLLFEPLNQNASGANQACIRWIDARWNCIPHLSHEKNNASQPPIIMHYAGRRWFQRLEGMITDALKNGYLRPGGARFVHYIAMLCIAKVRNMASGLYKAVSR